MISFETVMLRISGSCNMQFMCTELTGPGHKLSKRQSKENLFKPLDQLQPNE